MGGVLATHLVVDICATLRPLAQLKNGCPHSRASATQRGLCKPLAGVVKDDCTSRVPPLGSWGPSNLDFTSVYLLNTHALN